MGAVGPRAVPAPPPPALGSAADGSADCSAVRPRRSSHVPAPPAPTHIAPRPGRRRAPLPGAAAAAAARPELRSPCPAPPRGHGVGGHRRHQRDAAGRRTRSGRPARSLEGPFGGLCSREQGACAHARGRSWPAAERPWGRGPGGMGGAWRGGGAEGTEVGPEVPLPRAERDTGGGRNTKDRGGTRGMEERWAVPGTLARD